MQEFDARINLAWWLLRIGFGVGPIVAGLDKFFNKIVNWEMYLSPLATKVVPISPTTFMHIVGVIEIIAGLIVLSRWTKIGSYVVSLWLLGIVANLITTGMFYDLAVRDIELSLSAFALAQITAGREDALKRSSNANDRIAASGVRKEV